MIEQPIQFAQLISELRDAAFIIGISVVGWKARSIVQPIIDFFKRVTRHMDVMEQGMTTILNNHLYHMEADLRVIANRHKREDEVDNEDAFQK